MERSPPQQAKSAIGERVWGCDKCSSRFGRLDHLKRHELTHNIERSHVCHFCGALFSRGDVLRRHWQSCKTRLENGQEIPDGQRGGKHKRACDSCASIRKACNGEIPCSECTHRGRMCTYQRLYEGGDANADGGQASQKINNYSMDVDALNAESSWTLGLQSFYPSMATSRAVHARRYFRQ